MSDALSELEDEDFYELGEDRVRRATIKWLDADEKEKELVDAKVLESGDRSLKFAKTSVGSSGWCPRTGS
ncbi:hypothetical protein AKJ49_00825 [candidate division MSBL1 archaeon SCGC-AAA382A03]|uniref:Uncharacterized protein n=1 Tax=candidate division MSBL1 archaeon SCGC-AAA382A03 TaxID=1698278 RepID=A0A133VG59_9EURY|nr:hypothetical protein AKJ49_00825 [candidate division MSBL1 archaeon SCGC-AAA382A03]